MMGINIKYKNNLELNLQGDRFGKTFCQHQYTSYPLRLSPVFRLEGQDSRRAYLYVINTSPGLLAGDRLNLSVQLAANTELYLTDQAATKVHQMADINRSKATVSNQIIVNENASLELVPEPVILYRDSVLEQNTAIALHPTAKLFFSEIILPGRLAREEYYDFNYYHNRLKIVDLNNNLLFTDVMKLLGKNNFFKDNQIFTSLPIMGNAIAILPNIDIDKLISFVENPELIDTYNLEAAATMLPPKNGILIRVLAAKTINIKQYFTDVLDRIRQLTKQPSLPYIPK